MASRAKAMKRDTEAGNGQLFRLFPHTVNSVLSSEAECFIYEREEQATQEKAAPHCGRTVSGHASCNPYPAGRGQSGKTGCPRHACPGFSFALPTVRHALLYHRVSQQTA